MALEVFSFEVFMPTLEAQDCPLCRNGAEFFFVDDENRKHFRCGTCVEFQISLTMEKQLNDEQRVALSELAKRSTDAGILVITSPYGRTDVNPQLDFVAEFVHRTKLPR